MITVLAEEMRRWLVEMVALYFFVILFGTILLLLVAWFGRTYAKYHGTRTIFCPVSGTPATIELDALRTAIGSIMGHSDIQLLSCSRWPERGKCVEPCVKQLKPQAPLYPRIVDT